MFCAKCGKEVQEGWAACPFCGNNIGKAAGQTESEVVLPKTQKKEKPPKKKSGIVKKILIGIGIVFLLLILIGLFAPSDESSSAGDPADNEAKTVKTMEEVGGYVAWAESGYVDTVRTDIVVSLPVVEREADNYAVNIIVLGGDMIFVKQADGAMSTEWEWLNTAVSDLEGGNTATFQATLTLDGYYELDGETYPVFIAEDIQSYVGVDVQQSADVSDYTIENYLAGCEVVQLEALKRNPDAYIGKQVIVEGSLGTTMGVLHVGLWESVAPLVVEYDGVAYDENLTPIGNILDTDYGYVAGEYLGDDTIKAVVVVVTGSEDSVGDASVPESDVSSDSDAPHSYEMPNMTHDHNSFMFIGINGRYYDFSNGGDDVALSVEISNFTENTFDFVIYEYDNVIFKPHTAEITGESSGIYRGQQYTLYFEWSAEDRFQISGFEPVEGVTFIEPNYYGVS